MDKDSVQSALEVSRLQLEELKGLGPRAQEEALTQKALLQEELVTIRARVCDVSLEMERVWSQYERMESELSVIRSHLQHVCNFGVPQDQSQAQRELWMMEDILAGLTINRDHFRFLLGLPRHQMFQPTSPRPGSPTERLPSGLPVDVEPEPPLRPPLPHELQESFHSKDHSHGWTESSYEGVYGHTADPGQRRGNGKPPKDTFESGSKWIPPDTSNQSTKKTKMTEEEQIERMKRNQDRLTNKKKPPIPTPGQSSETRVEAPFPLRVTRVVTAVLPSSIVARRVSVEDPPPELDTPLPEQIPPEMHQRCSGRKGSNKPPWALLLEDQNHHDEPAVGTNRQQHQGILKSSKKEKHSELNRAEPRSRVQDGAAAGHGSDGLADEQQAALLTPDLEPNLCLTLEQREAKLRRVERIRERVIRSAVRQRAAPRDQLAIRGEGQEVHQVPPDTARKQRIKSEHRFYGSCDHIRGSAELQLCSGTTQEEEERERHVKTSKSQVKDGDKTQLKDHSVRTGVAKNKSKRPASPHHISSMTVYHKDGGKGITGCEAVEAQKLEEPVTDDNESDFSSADLKAKWFLSTDRCLGFTPLQIPGIDSCSEEISDAESQPACGDDATDSNEMSSTFSESLQKMRENHSLFYKITCDLTISDTDITANDVNPNAPTPCGPEEEDLQITESETDDATRNVGGSSNQERKGSSRHLSSDFNENVHSINNVLKDSTNAVLNTSASPTEEACVYNYNPQKECEDTSRQDRQSGVREAVHGASVQSSASDQPPVDEYGKTREGKSVTKESEKRKVDQERAKQLRKRHSLSEENREAAKGEGNIHSITPASSLNEGGSVIRSSSFGKARVTVLRTSL